MVHTGAGVLLHMEVHGPVDSSSESHPHGRGGSARRYNQQQTLDRRRGKKGTSAGMAPTSSHLLALALYVESGHRATGLA